MMILTTYRDKERATDEGEVQARGGAQRWISSATVNQEVHRDSRLWMGRGGSGDGDGVRVNQNGFQSELKDNQKNQ